MSEAKTIYLNTKGEQHTITFSQDADHAINNLINIIGDKPIDKYTRLEANLVRDTFFERGLGMSRIQRMINATRAIVSFVFKELGLAEIGAFSGIYLGENDKLENSKQQPIPLA